MGYLPIFTKRAISLLEYRHQLSRRSWKRKIGWAMNVDEMEWWWNHSWKVRIACFLVYSWNQFFEKLYLSRSIPRNRRHNDKKPEENVSYGLLMLLPPFICMVCPVLPSCLFKLILNVLDVTNRLSLRRTSLIGKPRLAVSSCCARRGAASEHGSAPAGDKNPEMRNYEGARWARIHECW